MLQQSSQKNQVYLGALKRHCSHRSGIRAILIEASKYVPILYELVEQSVKYRLPSHPVVRMKPDKETGFFWMDKRKRGIIAASGRISVLHPHNQTGTRALGGQCNVPMSYAKPEWATGVYFPLSSNSVVRLKCPRIPSNISASAHWQSL